MAEKMTSTRLILRNQLAIMVALREFQQGGTFETKERLKNRIRDTEDFIGEREHLIDGSP